MGRAQPGTRTSTLSLDTRPLRDLIGRPARSPAFSSTFSHDTEDAAAQLELRRRAVCGNLGAGRDDGDAVDEAIATHEPATKRAARGRPSLRHMVRGRHSLRYKVGGRHSLRHKDRMTPTHCPLASRRCSPRHDHRKCEPTMHLRARTAW